MSNLSNDPDDWSDTRFHIRIMWVCFAWAMIVPRYDSVWVNILAGRTFFQIFQWESFLWTALSETGWEIKIKWSPTNQRAARETIYRLRIMFFNLCALFTCYSYIQSLRAASCLWSKPSSVLSSFQGVHGIASWSRSGRGRTTVILKFP